MTADKQRKCETGDIVIHDGKKCEVRGNVIGMVQIKMPNNRLKVVNRNRVKYPDEF